MVLLSAALLLPLWLSCGAAASPSTGHEAGPSLGAAAPLRARSDKYPYVPNRSHDKKLPYVYRSDSRGPDEIRRAGGFRPRGAYAYSEAAFDVGEHMHFAASSSAEESDSGSESGSEPDEERPSASGFVSTASEAWYASHINQAVAHWVYMVHATPHMFVNDGVEDEVLAVGGILWEQVVGYYRLGPDEDFPTDAQVAERLVRNGDYDGPRFDGLLASPDLPPRWDHAHGLRSATAFLSRPEVGGPVGWTGRFPLPFRTYADDPAGEPPRKKLKPHPGPPHEAAAACSATQYGGHADLAFGAAYELLRHKKATAKLGCQEPQPGTSAQAAAADCARQRHQGDTAEAFASVYEILANDGLRFHLCSPIDEPEPASDITRHQQWAEVEQRALDDFEIPQGQLAQYLDRGLDWLRQNHEGLYNFIWSQYPAVFTLLLQLYGTGATIKSCLPKGHHFGKRDAARADGLAARHLGARPDSCARVVAMVDRLPRLRVCKNDAFRPPCSGVAAPLHQCVAIPGDYRDGVTALQPNVAAGSCDFYSEADCTHGNGGGSFKASYPGVDLFRRQDLKSFNDQVRSFKCGAGGDPAPAQPAAAGANGRWLWSSEVQRELCPRLDHLDLDFALTGGLTDGTYDKIKLDFPGAGTKMHLIAEDVDRGFHVEAQRIDIKSIFNSPTVELSQIRKLRLMHGVTGAFLGRDKWGLQGFKLHGRCAGSGINVTLDKFGAVNKEVEPHSDSPSGTLWKNWDFEVWSGFVAPDDWKAVPFCTHFDHVSVRVKIADRLWAETKNDLFIYAGRERVRIEKHLGRRAVHTAGIDIKKAYDAPSSVVPVADVKLVRLANEGGSSDDVMAEEMTVQGRCAGSEVLLEAKRRNDGETWTKPGQSWDLAPTARMWTKSA
ncbi:putative enterotoxin [Cordyceps sp. RAO-2017]|nr:putative enterotoxin [Cordyceps sp. RAO-2017]